MLALFCAGFLLASLDLRAANVTWSSAGNVTAGGNGNWTGGSTWWNGTSGVAWTASDNATFTAAGNTTVNSNVTAGTLTFTSSSANMSILAGAGNLTLNTGITATNSANTTALIQTVGANILLGGNLSISSTNGGTIGSMNLLLSGILSGAYGIDKNGNSNLTLNGTNSYTGQTKINNGNINVYSLGNFTENSNLGQGTAGVSIVIGSGATTGTIGMTYLGSGSTSNRTFQIGRGNGTSSATISSSGAGALVFTAANFNTADTSSVSGFSNRTLALSGTNTGANEIQGVISNNTNGTISITKSGAGTWKLSGNNTFSGGVSTTVGKVTAAHNNALGTGTVTMTGSNVYLELADGITIGNAMTVSSSGTNKIIQLASGATSATYSGNIVNNEDVANNFELSVGAGGTLTVSGNMSGIGLEKVSTGTLILSGNNTYTNTATITAGVLNIRHDNALGTTAAGTSVVSGAALELQGGITVGAEALTLSGTGLSTTGALRNISGDNSYAGAITLAAASRINSDSGLLNLSGAIGGTFALTVGGAGNTTISNAIGTSTGTLTKDGAGTLTLSSNNTYTGATTISVGVLNIRHANALGTTAAGTTVTSGAALELQGGITVGAEALSLSGTGLSTTGALRNISGDNSYAGAITLAAHSTIGSDAGTLTLSGGITGTKDLTIVGAGHTSIVGNITTSPSALTKSGAGTLFLSGTNSSFSGTTTINDGVVNVAYLTNNSVNGPLGAANDNASKLILVGGTLQYTGNNATSTDRNFTLLGNFTIDASGTASNATMSFAATGSNYKFSQTASATLTLTGSNTGSNVISGVITDNSSGNLTSLVKSGVGTWVLAGSNTYNGTTTINAGTLQIGPTGRLGAGSYAGNISNNATLIYSGTNAQTLSGIISGTGGLTHNASSTLTLTGNNTYTGTTTINAGTLQLGNNGATGSLSADSAITVDGALVFRRSDAITQGTQFSSAAIAGTGVVIHNSANSTTLTNNANSFSGGVWVQQGTVFASAIGNNGEASFLGSCGTIQLGSSSNTGTLRLTIGSPIETTDKVIDLSGTTGGGSIIAANATITMTGNLAMSGTGNKKLSFTSSGNTNTFHLNYSGLIAEGVSSVLSLDFSGSGNGNHTLTNASNSFSGAVSIVGNTASTTTTLNVAAIGNAGANSYLGKNSTINIGASSSGTNILKYTGTGETTDKVINLASTANNNQASLDASNASGLLKFTSDFTATGTASSKVLNLIGTGNAEIAGAIVNNTSGNVTNVTKSGAGTWTLSGNNTYTGTTTISGGNLVISGTNSGSAITVNSGGTLAGTGTGGNTTVNSGGTISPGNSPGILTVGDLTLNGNGTYTWEMADATGAAGTGWDQINATGLLTIGSNATSTFKIAITSSGAPANWDYTTTNQTWDIIDYGSISGFNASYFTFNSTAFGGDLSPDSSWSLVDTGSVLRLTYAYTLNTPTYTGASGDWSTGFTPSLDNTENAIFIGVGGTATNDIASGTLSSIGTLTFDGSNSYTLEAASGSAGYNSASALAIGGTVVNNSSAVQTINLATSFAANQTINANTGGLVIGGNVSIGTGAILTVVGSNNTTISGVVSGLGGLTKNSSSTLTLSGNNSYSGGTTLTAGTLLVGHDKALGTGTIRFGGTIASTDGTDRTISNTVAGLSGTWTYIFGQASGGTGNLTFTDAANATFASTGVKTFNVLNTTSFANAFISTGNVTVTKIGAGTLILAGNSTYSGSTIINAGTLQIGNGLTTGSLNATSAITLNGTLSFNRSNDITQGTHFSTAAIGGTGSIVQNGTGNLTLNAANTYSGGTTINSGAIVMGHANALGSSGNITFSGGGLKYATGITTDLSSRIKNSGSAILVDTNGESVTWGSALGSTNSGGLTKNGTGTLTLNAANTYTGGTTLNTGTLVIGNTAAAGTGTITQSNGTSLLKFDTTGTISNNMSIYNVASNQTMTLSGSITAQNTTYDVASGTTLSINGTISGSGGVTKNGTGTLTLSGNNTFTGNTTINSGTLRAGAANALGDTGEVMVNSGGSLLIAASEAIDNAAAIKLNGGTIEFDGNVTETLGAFSLLANSTIDMADGHIWLQFSGLSDQMQFDLKIYNYTLYSDYLYFVDVPNVSASLSRIQFYSDSGSSLIGSSFIENSFGPSPYHVRPVPEPETYATAALLLLGLGIYAYRRRQVSATI